MLKELLNERLKLDFICLSGTSFTRASGAGLLRCSSYFIIDIPSSAITSSYSWALVDIECSSSFIDIYFLPNGGLGMPCTADY